MVVTSIRRSQGKYDVVFVSICDGLDKLAAIAQGEKEPYFDQGRSYLNSTFLRWRSNLRRLVQPASVDGCDQSAAASSPVGKGATLLDFT